MVGKSSNIVDYRTSLPVFSENSMKLLANLGCFASKDALESMLVSFLSDSFSVISSLTYFLYALMS